MNLDINVYPEHYPIFHKSRQYLIKNHIANLESTKPKKLKICTSPGYKRDCEYSHYHQTTPEFPDLTHNRALSNVSNYQISYYPTSPLNPELEEQCMLLELFRNIDKLDFRKSRTKTPGKIVRIPKKPKFSGDIQNFHNFSVFSCKEVACPQCEQQKCICSSIDKISENIQQKLNATILPSVNKSIQSGKQTPNYKIFSKNEINIRKRISKRRKNKNILDYEGLKRNLLITPLAY